MAAAPDPGARPSQQVDFVLVAAGCLVLSSILFLLLRLFTTIPLPLDDQMAAATRFLINPLLSILPQDVGQTLVSALRTKSAQAAFFLWLIAALTAPYTVGWLGRKAKPLRTVLDFEKLIQIHAKRTPRVRVVLSCDPREDEDPDGPWAPTLTRYDWAVKHKVDVGPRMDLLEPPPQVRRAFLDQLNLVNPAGDDGGRSRALLCVRAVRAVCISRILEGRKAGNDVVDKFADSFASTTLDDYRKIQHGEMPLPCEDLINSEWDKLKDRDDVKEILADTAKRHGWISTRTVWLLDLARETTGVLEPSALLWLRPSCRVLWLALNQLGLNVAHVEACAVASHYQYEREIKKAATTPYLACAVFGLNEALADEGNA